MTVLSMFPVYAAASLIVAWLTVRRFGRGKPYPVWLSALIANRFTERFSGVDLVLDRAAIATGMTVLDAGCGPGRLSIPLARAVGPGGRVIALDVQDGMLARVRRRAACEGLGNVETLETALGEEALAGYADTFDRALLVTVLGEVPDKAGALLSLYRALKPEGILSVTEMVLDPDYVTRTELARLAVGAGFHPERAFGNALMFTMNLRKSG